MFSGKSPQSSSPSPSSWASPQNQLSYLWYQNASDSDRKPLAQTATLKSADPAYDWDAIMGLRPPSPVQEPPPRNPAPTLWTSTGSCDSGRLPDWKAPPSRLQDLGDGSDVPAATSDSCRTSPPLRNSNCRTYRRPAKQGGAKASDPGAFSGAVVGADLTGSTAAGRGRSRDHTVLHPSSVSMCNVTIHERSADGAPSGGGLGDAGWQRKKAEQQNSR